MQHRCVTEPYFLQLYEIHPELQAGLDFYTEFKLCL